MYSLVFWSYTLGGKPRPAIERTSAVMVFFICSALYLLKYVKKRPPCRCLLFHSSLNDTILASNLAGFEASRSPGIRILPMFFPKISA